MNGGGEGSCRDHQGSGVESRCGVCLFSGVRAQLIPGTERSGGGPLRNSVPSPVPRGNVRRLIISIQFVLVRVSFIDAAVGSGDSRGGKELFISLYLCPLPPPPTLIGNQKYSSGGLMLLA